MNVTVCELSDNPDQLQSEWQKLVDHVKSHHSDLVILPEMPFSPWMAYSSDVNPDIWESSVKEHEKWLTKLSELSPAAIVGTRPVTIQGKRLNEGFMINKDGKYHIVHHKYYLPDEEKFWEASWYESGEFEFHPATMDKYTTGMLICTEMWFTEHARAYAKQGVQILCSPRATGMASVNKWIAGGQAAAVMSGAYCLSSNRGGIDQNGFKWGGTGWIIEPEEGEVLGLTCRENPFVTQNIDLEIANKAKKTYPRYVKE